MPARLGHALIRAATSRTWPTEPGAPASRCVERLHRVDHAPRAARPRASRARCPGRSPPPRAPSSASRPAARRAAGSGRPTPRRTRRAVAAGGGQVAERHARQRRLADARRAAEQHERARHEAAAEDGRARRSGHQPRGPLGASTSASRTGRAAREPRRRPARAPAAAGRAPRRACSTRRSPGTGPSSSALRRAGGADEDGWAWRVTGTRRSGRTMATSRGTDRDRNGEAPGRQPAGPAPPGRPSRARRRPRPSAPSPPLRRSSRPRRRRSSSTWGLEHAIPMRRPRAIASAAKPHPLRPHGAGISAHATKGPRLAPSGASPACPEVALGRSQALAPLVGPGGARRTRSRRRAADDDVVARVRARQV